MEESVYFLIVELCEALGTQHEYRSGNILPPHVRKKNKSLAYEILLKKSKKVGLFYNDQHNEFDVQRAFAQHIFASKMAIANSGCTEQHHGITKLENEVEDVFSNTSTCTIKEFSQICQLLLLLKSYLVADIGESQLQTRHNPILYEPAPFAIHGNYKGNRNCCMDCTNMFIIQPQYFSGISDIKCTTNPYILKTIFQNEAEKLYDIERKHELYRTKANKLVNPFRSFTNLISNIPINKFKTKTKKVAVVIKESDTKYKQVHVGDQSIFTWNWENLACLNVYKATPFSSETNVSFDMLGHHYYTIGHVLHANIVNPQTFLLDLKALTVGIQSESFWHDEYIIFHMQKDLSIEELLPSTMDGFIRSFLECGTCFKRLSMMIMKKDYRLMFEGFIFKALCNAVDEYLITFRQFVFAQEDKHFMDFYKRLQISISQITNLSFTLAIHPQVNASIKPPLGSQFLGYLYREIMRLTEPEYLTLLIFLLKRCCHVYFKHLQKWIYYGVLDDPSNELFICFLDHYRQNTKYFYEKAYFVRKESVPGFFQNYEDQILQCGKYTILLKAFKPNHPLFHMEYPAMTVCLSFEEIDKLESNCKKYYQLARECCGKPVTIRGIFEAREQEKRAFCQMASKCSKANMEIWLSEQHSLALVRAEEKKKRLEQFSLQLQNEKERKIAERRVNVEFELKHLREAEKMNDNLLVGTNINLRKRIEYYEELSNLMRENTDTDEDNPEILTISLTNAEGNENINQHPHTPSSIVGTDFESCEEDAYSEYTECISDEFVQHFAQNEIDLNILCEYNSKNGENVNNNEAVYDVEAIDLNHSVSDVLNFNEFSTAKAKDIRQDSKIALSTQENKVTCALGHTEEKHKVKVLTEAKKNKLKIMSEEFGIYNPDCQYLVPDINLNTLAVGELSEAQRNRKRMMDNNPFSTLCKDPIIDRSQLHLELNTERSRNRRKVLESEFNILTGSKIMSPKTLIDIGTPMSTTSDPPFSDVLANSEKCQDMENMAATCVPSLKLEISQIQSKLQEEKIDSAPVLNETPDSALNTTGIMAKHGFNFIRSNKTNDADEVPIQNDKFASEQSSENENFSNLQQDYSEPYNRCFELIKSNFQCPTRSQYVQLQKLPLQYNAVNKIDDENYQSFIPLDMNSMNAITLTEFLQQSIIKPMKVHLHVLNNEVMRMFIDDLRILDHFRNLRHYFFLMNGEFGAKICDGILEQLDSVQVSPQKLLNYQMLHSILDTALGSSTLGNGKHLEPISFIVKDIPEHFDLCSPNVLQTLSLSYHIEWPLNLILSPEVLEQYNNIFQYLIKVRRISWLLEHAYQLLKEAVKNYGKKLLGCPQYRHIQLMRHKFYHFVHSLQNHITASALQASWKTFKDDLLNANSIKDICKKHAAYLKKILLLCMLNRRSIEFHNTIENILKITLHFYNNLKADEFKIKSDDITSSFYNDYSHSRYEALVEDESEFDKLIKHAIYLAKKIVRHGDQTEIGEFINLINYNQYYIHIF